MKKELLNSTSESAIMRTDGLDSFDLTVDDDISGGGLVTYISFGSMGAGPWTDRRTGEPLPVGLRATVVGAKRGVRRFFGPGERPEVHLVAPGEKLANRAQELNATVPRDTWELSRFTGQPKAPYEPFHELLFVAEPDFAPLSWAVSCESQIATGVVTDLRARIRWARKHYGNPLVAPLVLFTDTGIITKRGPRRKPVLEVLEWRTPDGKKAQLPQQRLPESPPTQPNDGIGVEPTEKPDFGGDKVPY